MNNLEFFMTLSEDYTPAANGKKVSLEGDGLAKACRERTGACLIVDRTDNDNYF